MIIHGRTVAGLEVDARTGCAHYRGHNDIIAIKFPCCKTYHACYKCHEAVAGHTAQIWKHADFEQKAVLCGKCGTELTIRQYLQSNDTCPACHSTFNPGCISHYHLYFEV